MDNNNDNNNNNIHNVENENNNNNNENGDIVLPPAVQNSVENLPQPIDDIVNNDEDLRLQVPDAPVKVNGFWIRKPRLGLPRPFEQKPAARRGLFVDVGFSLVAPLSPLPPTPPCPARKPVIRAKSFVNINLNSALCRKLNFDLADDSSETQRGYRSPSEASNELNESLLKAPKKRRYPEEEDDEELVGDDDVGVDDGERPAAPANNPATPADHVDDMENNDERWAWISTPKSAPLPTYNDSPRKPRTNRRKSDGGACYTRKRLLF